MRRVLRLLAVALAILIVILVGNTLRQGARPRPPAAPPPADSVDAGRAALHLAGALRFQTVSHEGPSEETTAKLAGLREFLEKTYPKVHASLSRETVDSASLLYAWRGSEPALAPALLAAHLDVVPVEPGTAAGWKHPPFEGVVEGGFVWGRGAMDDKGAVVAILEACESLLAEGWRPRRTIYLAFGQDEEVGGAHGAKKIAALLQARGIHLEYALDEGMAVTDGVVPGVKVPVALIGIAEKGYASLELVAEVNGGHSSMPEGETAIGVLAKALTRLEERQMPARLDVAERMSLGALAPSMSFGRRLVLSNLWLFGPLVRSALARTPAGNAMIRTTTAPTILQAGVKDNVLPSRARAVVNFRLLPGDRTDAVVAHARSVIADGRVRINTQPEMLSEPSPESSTESRIYRRLETVIGQYFPGALVSPGLVVGATDGRHYAGVAEGVYRFVPMVLHADDLHRIHGTDERLGVDTLATAVRAYRQILRDEP